MKKLFKIVMLILVLCVIAIFGQETEEVQEQPKEIEFNKGFFTSYKYNDGEKTRKLNSGELEKMIISINDEEATRHFRKSETLQNTSLPFQMAGGFLMGWPIGGLIAGKDFDTRIFAAGCGISTVGVTLAFFAHKERVKSVERYNAVVKEEWGFNFQYLPKNNQIGLNLRYSF